MKIFGRELTDEQIIGACKTLVAEKCCNDCLLVEGVNTLLAEINRLQELNAKYIETITKQWISINDRLPTVDEYGDVHVLVCMDDEYIATTDYIEGEGFELWAESGEVTHWMELPKPPKGCC